MKHKMETPSGPTTIILQPGDAGVVVCADGSVKGYLPMPEDEDSEVDMGQPLVRAGFLLWVLHDQDAWDRFIETLSQGDDDDEMQD